MEVVPTPTGVTFWYNSDILSGNDFSRESQCFDQAEMSAFLMNCSFTTQLADLKRKNSGWDFPRR